MTGLERNLVGFSYVPLFHSHSGIHLVFSLRNYNPKNDDIHGDFWNVENLSWFSNQRARKPSASLAQTGAVLDRGARRLESAVRPYPAKVAGIPLQFNYELNNGTFALTWADPIQRRPVQGNHGKRGR